MTETSGTDRFTASNGMIVTVLGVSGIVRIEDPLSPELRAMTIDPIEADVLREFFEQERLQSDLIAVLPKVTRLTVVREDGTYFEKYDMYRSGVDIYMQDEGRTLKIFPRSTEEEA